MINFPRWPLQAIVENPSSGDRLWLEHGIIIHVHKATASSADKDVWLSLLSWRKGTERSGMLIFSLLAATYTSQKVNMWGRNVHAIQNRTRAIERPVLAGHVYTKKKHAIICWFCVNWLFFSVAKAHCQITK